MVVKMKLLTKEIRKAIPPMYSQDGLGGKSVVHMKMFTPDSSWTWYVTEGEPIFDDDNNEIDYKFFGLVDGFEKELGYFMLSELEKVKGPLGLPIERDLYWDATPLDKIAPDIFAS